MAAKASRLAFGEALVDIADQFPNVVVLDADLSKSTMSCLFAEKYPERFFEFGIAEANMIGAGAGMALSGKTPFVCSFACFVTGRFDTIRISVGYSQSNVKIVGTHSGVGIGEDGHSQMGLEDLALMRSIPGMIVLHPADEIETKQAVAFAAEHKGPVYLRLTRQKLNDVNNASYKFEVGKGVVLALGSDMTIIATGGTVQGAVGAKELLAKEGVDARIVNLHTIKPIDKDLLVQCAKETGCIYTTEDHTVMGGMGSAVTEVLSEFCPTPIKRGGVQDVFGESGSPDDMYQKHKLNADGIAEQALAFFKSVKK